jgi:type I restriction enzyme S subunit
VSFALVPLRRYVTSACDGPFGSALKSDHYSPEGARVIRLGNIGAAHWRDDDAAFVPVEYWQLLSRHAASAGDLVLAGLGDDRNPVGRACVLPDVGPALVKADCFRLRINHLEASSRFLAWYLCSHPALAASEMAAEGSTRQRLTLGKTLALKVPLISLERQIAVADFLDRETARIDAVIAAKRRMIEVVGEQQAAWSVRHVLGEGDSSTRSPSPSGFYGGVPKDWNETALRHLGCEVQTGPFGSQLHADDYVEAGWPVVNPMNIVDGGMRAVDSMTVSEAKRQELVRHVLRRGDIVFGRRGEMGRAGLVGPEQEGWLCGTGSLRLRLTGAHLLPSYLLLLLSSPPARAYFELTSVGSTMDNLNSEIVLSFPTLVPPMEVQQAIVVAIADHKRFARDVDLGLARQVDLLFEHRHALVTAAVTGEIDVRGAAA